LENEFIRNEKMKSNRILLVILIVIIIVFVGMAGWLYSGNSKTVKQNNELTNNIASNQATVNKGKAAVLAQQNQATTLQNELTAAQTALAQISVPTSAESIKYDAILFSLAADSQLKITSLSATPASSTQENNNTYQITTFTVNVEGIAPDKIFGSAKDSASYVSATVNNILAYANKIASSPDFSTAEIPSVSITSQASMTDADITSLNNNIAGIIQAGLSADETQGLTADEVAALVQAKLTALKPDQVQALIEQAGLTKPMATITIRVWVLKGA